MSRGSKIPLLDLIADAYERGDSLREIAKNLKISLDDCRYYVKWLRRRGVISRHRTPDWLDADT